MGAVVLFGVFSACANTSSVQTEESPSFLEEDISMQAPLEISDDDLSKLLSGALAFDELSQDEVSLDEPSSVILEEDAESNSESISESAVQEELLQESETPPSKEPPAESAQSQSTASKPAGSKTPVSEKKPTTSSSAASAARPENAHPSSESKKYPPVPAYEIKVKKLVQEAYALKDYAEKGLSASINAAKAEYDTLKPEQKTQFKKISITLSKAGELTRLQSYCDKEMDRIVKELRTVLKDNGQNTALADQVMDFYTKEKDNRYKQLMSELYG